MTKKLIAVLLLATALFLFTACAINSNNEGAINSDISSSQKSDNSNLKANDKTNIYGVVFEEDNILLLYIPEFGHLEIPSADTKYSLFNLELKDYNYNFKVGDLVCVSFNKSAKEITIIEIYPSKFSENPNELIAYSQNLTLSYDNNCYKITELCPDSLKNASVGDTVSFVKINCVETNYCNAEIVEIKDGYVSLKLDKDIDIQEFLSLYTYSLEQKI